ncbi:transporter [Camelimonas fluminis]|uniref:DMT family transporter n=1 Tax=Camelimonas fluminis TaxID=1576911 RepID=A0ABV7UI41_9HYPH|nr:DMT family transporter [Camelimonas fluminis]GHE68048.1 transporter [Camelimonas fluminis]
MHPQPSRNNLALVTLLGLIWGLNWPIVKFAILEYGPWTTRALSLSGAALVLVAASLWRGQSLRISPRDWWRVLVPAIFGMALVNILNAWAQMVMETGRAAIIAFSMPVWATAMAVFFLGERLDARKSLSLALGAAGLLALAWPALAAGGLSAGLALALGSAMSWACGAVFMKRFPINAPPLIAATWQIGAAAAILTLGMLAFEGATIPFHGLTNGFLGLAYNIVAAQAIGTWIWFGVLTRSPASVAAIGTLMTPGVGVIGAMLMLGETPALTDWLGLALVVSASAIVLLRRAPAGHPAPVTKTPPPPCPASCGDGQLLAPAPTAR